MQYQMGTRLSSELGKFIYFLLLHFLISSPRANEAKLITSYQYVLLDFKSHFCKCKDDILTKENRYQNSKYNLDSLHMAINQRVIYNSLIGNSNVGDIFHWELMRGNGLE